MKTVRLPIYEDGVETKDYLEIDIRYFLGEASSEVAHRFVKVEHDVEHTEAYVANLEIDNLNRIVSGLPPNPWPEIMLHGVRGMKYGAVPKEEPVTVEDKWRPIPGFSKYVMNRTKKIATASDGKSVSIVKGGSVGNALLTNDDRIDKRMSVDFLFQKTFPELAK